MSKKTRQVLSVTILITALLLAVIIGFFLPISQDNAPSSSEKEASSSVSPDSNSDYDNLVITNLNVGKADCAVLEYKDSVGIIDAGTKESYSSISAFLSSKNISNIDYLILTHYDKDHIGGAIQLLSSFPCDKIYLPDYESSKEYYHALMDAVDKLENVIFVNETVSFSYEDVSLKIIPADDPVTLLDSDKNRDNNMSLVTMVHLGKKKFLFTGDIEKDRISQMLSFHDDLEADWMKIPHHGEYQKKVSQLLESVLPQFAVISTSYERPPDDKLIDLLKSDNIATYDTLDSNVVTVCDGEKITVTSD